MSDWTWLTKGRPVLLSLNRFWQDYISPAMIHVFVFSIMSVLLLPVPSGSAGGTAEDIFDEEKEQERPGAESQKGGEMDVQPGCS